MTLEEMQQRLQALFKDKQNFDQQAEKFRQQSLMVQGHINELSFIIQSLAQPAASPGDNSDADRIREETSSGSGDCLLEDCYKNKKQDYI